MIFSKNEERDKGGSLRHGVGEEEKDVKGGKHGENEGRY